MQTDQRYHALDALRASMMLLGIYLHVVVGYSGDGNWPYIDPHPTSALNWTLGVIHAFRMPAFFMMAGFFGALLWERRGPRAFAVNRWKRIAVPFALFWTLLFVPMAAVVVSRRAGPGDIVSFFTTGAFVQHLHPMHLWFLEYLLLLYGIGAAAASVSRWLPMAAIHSIYRWMLESPAAPLLFALFSWLPLTLMNGTLKDCDGFRPEGRILLAYLVPFTAGWLLFPNRDLLPRFRRHARVYAVLAVPAFLVYARASGRTQPLLKAGGNVLLCWLVTFALVGLFLRIASEHSARWRYMSDASYWLFIMHMPVVVGLQVAMAPVPVPALAKVPIVLALSLGLLLISYNWLVRPTWMGEMLNGRRYPRG